MRRAPLSVSALLVLLAGTGPAAADTCGHCSGACGPRREYPLDLSVRRGDGTAEAVRGPVTLALVKLNKVRYEISIGQEVTISDGPDLSLAGLIPDFSASAPDVAPAAEDTDAAEEIASPALERLAEESLADLATDCPPDTGTLNQRLEAIRLCLAVEAERVENLLESAAAASELLNGRSTSVQKLVNTSDQTLLEVEGAERLAGLVTVELGSIESDLDAAKKLWPGADQVAKRKKAVEELAQALAQLPFARLRESGQASAVEDWTAWIGDTHNYIRYRELEATAQELLESLEVLGEGGEIAKAYREVAAALRAWQNLLRGLTAAEAYSICIPVRCGFPFWEEKTFEYTATLVDRTIADKTKNKSTEKLAKVVCPSHFMLSGGIALSGITERDYGFVQSLPDPPPMPQPPPDPPPADGEESGEDEPALITRIGIENESDEQINPTILISTRLRSWAEDGAVGLHLSAGSMADFDNPDGGLQFGYLLGVSVSFKDSFLLTVGAAAARVPSLAGGFEVDDPQPSGLDKVPVTREWHFEPMLGITYKLGGGG